MSLFKQVSRGGFELEIFDSLVLRCSSHIRRGEVNSLYELLADLPRSELQKMIETDLVSQTIVFEDISSSQKFRILNCLRYFGADVQGKNIIYYTEVSGQEPKSVETLFEYAKMALFYPEKCDFGRDLLVYLFQAGIEVDTFLSGSDITLLQCMVKEGGHWTEGEGDAGIFFWDIASVLLRLGADARIMDPEHSQLPLFVTLMNTNDMSEECLKKRLSLLREFMLSGGDFSFSAVLADGRNLNFATIAEMCRNEDAKEFILNFNLGVASLKSCTNKKTAKPVEDYLDFLRDNFLACFARKPSSGTTWAHLFADEGCLEGVKFFSEKNIPMGTRRKDGSVPLHFAVSRLLKSVKSGSDDAKKRKLVFKTLLESGVDVNVPIPEGDKFSKKNCGKSVAMRLLDQSQLEMLELLLRPEYHCDVYRSYGKHGTLLEYVRGLDRVNSEVLKLIEARGLVFLSEAE